MTQHIEYCHSCGAAISEPSSFCANCGTRLTEPEPIGASSAVTNSSPTGNSTPAQGTPTVTAAATQGAAQPPKAPPRGAPESPSATAAAAQRGASAQSAAPQSAAPQSATPSGASPGARPPGAIPPGATPPGTPPGGPWSGPTPAGEPPSKGGRKWIPIAAVSCGALVALGLVVVLLITLGGSAGKDVKSASATREQALQLLAANGTTTVSRAAPGLFALVSAGQLTAVVPAGWRATAQTAATATRAEFADPAHPTSTVTIVAQKGAPDNSHGQALAARKTVSAKGNAIGSFGHISFPGGRRSLASDLYQRRNNPRDLLLPGLQYPPRDGGRRVSGEQRIPARTGFAGSTGGQCGAEVLKATALTRLPSRVIA